jgi:hypothetical protein
MHGRATNIARIRACAKRLLVIEGGISIVVSWLRVRTHQRASLRVIPAPLFPPACPQAAPERLHLPLLCRPTPELPPLPSAPQTPLHPLASVIVF